MRNPILLATGASVLAGAIGAHTLACDFVAPRINEIRISQPGPDFDEYFEIAGPPGFVLNSVSYIVVGAQSFAIPPTQNGFVQTVIDLDGVTIPADGVLLVAKDTFSLGTPDVVANFSFTDLRNVTHLLVVGFTGQVGDELDTNNDGILDVTPWDVILCDVALVIDPNPDGISQDFFYSDTVVGPDGFFTPSHVWRCSDTLDWNIGAVLLGADDTPGEPNPDCLVDAPAVRINEIRVNQPGQNVDLYFELFGEPNASLSGLHYITIAGNATDGSGVIVSAVSLTGSTIPASGYFLAAEDLDTFGAVPDLITTLGFTSGNNVTHLLVSGFTGFVGQDLDLNDDGVLDVTPWSEVIDSVGIVTGNFPPPGPQWNFVYSDTIVGPDANFLPGHVYVCEDTLAWEWGPFSTLAGVRRDTPGAPNFICSACTNLDAGSCFEAGTGPGCTETPCCEAVCAIDPACCEVIWDAACASAASSVCAAEGAVLALWTFEVSQPTSAGPHAAESGVYGGSALGIHASPDASYTTPVGNGSPRAFNSNNWQVGDSYQFSTSTLGFEDIQFGWSQTRSTTGPTSFMVEWSLDGVDFDTLLSYTVANINWASGTLNPASVFLPVSLPKAADNQPTVWVRLTTTVDGSAVTGTSRVDDVYFTGIGDVIKKPDPCGDRNLPDCFTEHAEAGCSDAECCELVCAQDPSCCEVAWDANCVGAAESLCVSEPGPDFDTLALWTFEVSQPNTAGPHAAEDGLFGGDAIGVHANPATSWSTPVGNGSARSFSSNNWSQGDYYQFSTSTVGYEEIRFGWSQTRSGTGPADFLVEWSADGVNFDTVFGYAVAQVTWNSNSVNDDSVYGPVLLPEGARDLPQIWVRLTNAVRTSPAAGTNRVDDVFFAGVLIDDEKKTPCPADLDGNGVVDGADLGILLNAWGTNNPAADLDGNGIVDGADLGILLNAWGACP